MFELCSAPVSPIVDRMRHFLLDLEGCVVERTLLIPHSASRKANCNQKNKPDGRVPLGRISSDLAPSNTPYFQFPCFSRVPCSTSRPKSASVLNFEFSTTTCTRRTFLGFRASTSLVAISNFLSFDPPTTQFPVLLHCSNRYPAIKSQITSIRSLIKQPSPSQHLQRQFTKNNASRVPILVSTSSNTNTCLPTFNIGVL
ncbi:hypothetical protein BDZ45DRAFT_52275 [Acephala macrosclerotiorum]|nr:hypothetical protein BDZ45DRAFT_52275 [Acephala macrosclerotiorum]